MCSRAVHACVAGRGCEVIAVARAASEQPLKLGLLSLVGRAGQREMRGHGWGCRRGRRRVGRDSRVVVAVGIASAPRSGRTRARGLVIVRGRAAGP